MAKRFAFAKVRRNHRQNKQKGRKPKLPRLKDTYKAEIVPAMMQKFNYKSVMQVPKLEKK